MLLNVFYRWAFLGGFIELERVLYEKAAGCRIESSVHITRWKLSKGQNTAFV